VTSAKPLRCSIVVVISLIYALLAAGSALGACTQPQKVLLDNGGTPGGGGWSLSATLQNNGSCEQWLFGLEFGSHEFGYSSSGTAIPAGGQVRPGSLRIEASDILNRKGTSAAFFGYADRDVAKIIGVSRTGKHFVVRPRLVAPAKIRGRAWLRSFRYFVFFHSGTTLIERLSVIGPDGEVIETAENRGLFFN